jgi:hypothetical protein
VTDYPAEIWLYKPWADHPDFISQIWLKNRHEEGVMYIRADRVHALLEDGCCSEHEDSKHAS